MKANFTDSNTRSNLFKWSDFVYPPGANIYPAMGSFSRGNCRPELRGYVRNFLAVIRLKRDFDDFRSIWTTSTFGFGPGGTAAGNRRIQMQMHFGF